MGKHRRLLPALILAALLMAGCGENRQETNTATVPPAPEKTAFSVEGALLDQAEAVLARTEALPDLKAAPLDVEAEELYTALTGDSQVDTMTRDVVRTPAPSTTVCLYRGEAPWYDTYFFLETMEAPSDMRTSACFSNLRYRYLYTIFDPVENESSLSDTALPFASPETVSGELESGLSICGVELGNMRCKSLTAQALQALWDERSGAGTLREIRWAEAGSQIKDRSSVAEQERWTEDDACYYLTAQQSFQGVPLEGMELFAYVGQEGPLDLDFSLVGLQQTGDSAPLAEFPVLRRALNEAAEGIYAPDGCTLTDLALWYCPTGEGSYVPQWRAIFAYSYTDPDGNGELREAEVRLDARTGREIPMEAAE